MDLQALCNRCEVRTACECRELELEVKKLDEPKPKADPPDAPLEFLRTARTKVKLSSSSVSWFEIKASGKGKLLSVHETRPRP